MDLEQRLRASLVAPDPGAMFTARVMARVARAAIRRRTGLILMGTLLAVGAAAAMLAWRPPPDVQSLPAHATSVPAASDSEPASLEQIAQLVPEMTRSGVTDPPAESPPQTAPSQLSPQYSVLMMPLRQQAQNPAGPGPVEALHESLIDELRKVPGLTLHVQGESERRADIEVDFELTLTSLVTTSAQFGGVVVRSTDGDTAYVVNGGSAGGIVTTVRSGGGGGGGGAVLAGGAIRSLANAEGASSFTGSGTPDDVLWVEMRVTPRHSAASRYTFPVGVEGAARPQQCNDPEGAVLSECMTPAQLAIARIEDLRLQVFPPDAAFQQRVVARLGELNLDECSECRDFTAGERKALQVLQRMTGDGGSRLDAGTIQAIARYAASQPARMRANVWSTLRWAKVSHPALASPLVETLRHDPDLQVRLVALAHLEANYAADPVVRNALAAIGREDPGETVRVAVRRVLYGEAQWRDEILTALHDGDLPYEARLAPLLVSGLAVSPLQQEHRRAVLQEQQVLLPLTTLLREHRLESAQAQVTSSVLGLLASFDDPVVFDLFMQLVRDRQLARETVVLRNGLDLSGPVSSWLMRHRDDPRVLQLLSEVDPQLRAMIEQSRPLSEVAVQVPPELTGPPPALLERIREVTRQAAPAAP